MQESAKPKATWKQKKFTAFDVWERFGITEHEGGIYATQRLIALCDITLGQYVLDIGCGTGYTSCLLARKYKVDVVAVDVTSKILEEAKKRIIQEDFSDKVTTIKADAQELPFPANTFDAVIAESVLVHSSQKKVSSEAYRVLKPGGVFGFNEVTYIKSPPIHLLILLRESLNIRPLQEDEWQAVLTESGFVDVSSTLYKINFWEQFISHLRVDGVRSYISALYEGISDPTIRDAFFTKDMLKGLKFLSYVGYGLYVGRKGSQKQKKGLAGNITPHKLIQSYI